LLHPNAQLPFAFAYSTTSRILVLELRLDRRLGQASPGNERRQQPQRNVDQQRLPFTAHGVEDEGRPHQQGQPQRGEMALFTKDTHFVVYMNAKDPKPSQELHSREDLAPVFADLNKYDATTHFVGQSTILALAGNHATGEAYCLAHHVTVNGDKRRLMVASLRYNDTFVKINGAWLFAERLLYVDWMDERALS